MKKKKPKVWFEFENGEIVCKSRFLHYGRGKSNATALYDFFNKNRHLLKEDEYIDRYYG